MRSEQRIMPGPLARNTLRNANLTVKSKLTAPHRPSTFFRVNASILAVRLPGGR